MQVLQSLRTVRAPLTVLLDAVTWFIALAAAAWTWDAISGDASRLVGLFEVCILVMALHVLTAWAVGDLLRHTPVGSRTNTILVSAVVFTAGFWSAIANALPFTQWLPFAVPVVATPLALGLQVSARMTWRFLRERLIAHWVATRGARRALVVGVGAPARQLVRSMLSDPQTRYWPVGFLAYNAARRGDWACGLPVLGTSDEIGTQLAATGSEVVILAAPAADLEPASKVVAVAVASGVGVKLLPPAAELAGPLASVGDLRDLDTSGSYDPAG